MSVKIASINTFYNVEHLPLPFKSKIFFSEWWKFCIKKIELILIVCHTYVLWSHWIGEYWTTAPRENTELGSHKPLVPTLSQLITL